MSKLSSRKLIVSLAVLVTGLVIGLVKGDVPPNILQLLEVIAGTYVVGNVLSGVTEGAAKPKKEQHKPQEVAQASSRQDLVELYSAIKETDQKVEKLLDSTDTIAKALTMLVESKNGK